MKLLLAFYLLSTHVSFAAEKVTWNQSVSEAAQTNAELKAASSTYLSSQYQVGVARSGFLPSISATAGVGYDSSRDPKSYSLTISATENLFAGFSDQAKTERARSQSLSSEANLISTKAKISFDLKSAFMGLLYSQKYIALTEDIIKRREANLKLVQLRFESGRENLGSINLSKAYLAQAQFDNLQAVNSLEIYQAELARVLGRDDYDQLEVDGVVPTSMPLYKNGRVLNFKGLIQDMPDFKKAYYDEQASRSSLTLSRSNFFPSLNLNQTAGRTGREINSPVNSWSVGAALTFPLFNGGEDYYSYKSASEDYRASVHLLKNTESDSVTRLKTAYNRYVEAVMRLAVDEAFVLAGNSRERIAKAQYNNGLISFTDWDTIENDLITRQKSLLQSQRDRVVAEATWEQVQGRGVIP